MAREQHEVAGEHAELGWSAKQIHEQHPDLSLAQIHAALAYYYDHQDSLDGELEADARLVERLREEAGESPVMAQPACGRSSLNCHNIRRNFVEGGHPGHWNIETVNPK